MTKYFISSLGFSSNKFGSVNEIYKKLNLNTLKKRDKESKLTKRVDKKVDTFAKKGILAIEDNFCNMDYTPSEHDLNALGVLVLNQYAGWGIAEESMQTIYKTKDSLVLDHINPYIATAWFPTALQGEISILYKLLGYSKTFASNDGLSVLIEEALLKIDEGDSGFILGYAEAVPKTLSKSTNSVDPTAFFLTINHEKKGACVELNGIDKSLKIEEISTSLESVEYLICKKSVIENIKVSPNTIFINIDDFLNLSLNEEELIWILGFHYAKFGKTMLIIEEKYKVILN